MGVAHLLLVEFFFFFFVVANNTVCVSQPLHRSASRTPTCLRPTSQSTRWTAPTKRRAIRQDVLLLTYVHPSHSCVHIANAAFLPPLPPQVMVGTAGVLGASMAKSMVTTFIGAMSASADVLAMSKVGGPCILSRSLCLLLFSLTPFPSPH